MSSDTTAQRPAWATSEVQTQTWAQSPPPGAAPRSRSSAATVPQSGEPDLQDWETPPTRPKAPSLSGWPFAAQGPGRHANCLPFSACLELLGPPPQSWAPLHWGQCKAWKCQAFTSPHQTTQHVSGTLIPQFQDGLPPAREAPGSFPRHPTPRSDLQILLRNCRRLRGVLPPARNPTPPR